MDKVTRAEWKLAGLCELCGCSPNDAEESCAYGNRFGMECADDSCFRRVNFYNRVTDLSNALDAIQDNMNE